MRCALITIALALVGLVAAPRGARAEYAARFSGTVRGGLTLTGNSLGLSSDGGSGPGSIGSIGAFVAPDPGSAAPGGWPGGTTADWTQSGAWAELRLPEGAAVLHAELVWGAYCEDLPAWRDTPVRVLPPGGAEVSVDPAAGLAFDDADKDFYARAVDVTALVAAHGAGMWRVGGVPATLACGADCNLRSSGWSLIVAYERADWPLRDLGIWVGLEPGGGAPATLTGLCTPSSGDVRARALVSALEGDFQGYGDNLAFGPVGGPLTYLSGPNNAINNFFAAHINGDDGRVDTAGSFGEANLASGASGPGRHGWDLTQVDASGILVAGATAAAAQGVTSNEQYRVVLMGLQIDTGQPRFEAPGTGASVTPAAAVVGETVSVVWQVANSGAEPALDVALALALPAGLVPVPGSLTRDGELAPETDPEAGMLVLGDLAPGASASMSLLATVAEAPPGGALAPEAELTWDYAACGVAASGVRALAPAPLGVARLEVGIEAEPAGPVSPGDTVSFRATIANVGAGATRVASLGVAWGEGLAYVAGSTRVDGVARADGAQGGPFAGAGPIGAAGVLAPGAQTTVSWAAVAAAAEERREVAVRAEARGHAEIAASAAEAAVAVVVTVCGDGLVGGREGCDAGAANSDEAADACRTDCQTARCGDGVRDAAEACDDGNGEVEACGYGGASCVVCGAGCAEVAGVVRGCGDGVLEADEGEGCDAGEANSDEAADACRTDCRPARCGDGVRDEGERCDDGNLDDTDGCDRACDDRRCGDGEVDEGEVCDPGAGPVLACAYGDAACRRCTADCGGWVADAARYCGDGRVDAADGERCDDGNAVTEVCSYGLVSCAVCGAACRLTVGAACWCGDGRVDGARGEQCDDANREDGDGCSAFCTHDVVRVRDDGGCAAGDGGIALVGAAQGWLAARRRRRVRRRG